MIRNRKASADAAKLSPELTEERKWLNRNAPTFGNVAPEDYTPRAKAFNEQMREIGAVSLLVVEK